MSECAKVCAARPLSATANPTGSTPPGAGNADRTRSSGTFRGWTIDAALPNRCRRSGATATPRPSPTAQAGSATSCWGFRTTWKRRGGRSTRRRRPAATRWGTLARARSCRRSRRSRRWAPEPPNPSARPSMTRATTGRSPLRHTQGRMPSRRKDGSGATGRGRPSAGLGKGITRQRAGVLVQRLPRASAASDHGRGRGCARSHPPRGDPAGEARCQDCSAPDRGEQWPHLTKRKHGL